MSRVRSRPFDLVLRAGRLWDSERCGDVADIAIVDDRIVEIGCIRGTAKDVIDVTGYDVLPGLVDLHVHASSEFSGRAAHAMMARAGVTTALDLAGPVEDVRAIAKQFGVGLTIGCIDACVPGRNISSGDVGPRELRSVVDRAVRAGACGIKILGGHFPLTPDATREAISVGAELGVWTAVHCGTTTAGSNLEGMEQLLELREDHPVHIAHVSSYCRGSNDSPLIEAARALELLEAAAGVFSESYVARINGTWGTCVDGKPISRQTLAALHKQGFEQSEAGVESALRQGYARAHVMDGDNVQLEGGAAGVTAWRLARTQIPLSFPVNDLSVGIAIATARMADRGFVVDAWATDGGGIPRNNTLAVGYGLIALGMLTLQELASKAATVPAEVFGLTGKGRVEENADADLVIVDPPGGSVQMTIARGRVIAREGRVLPHRTAWMCLNEGTNTVLSDGFEVITLERPHQPVGIRR